MLNTLSSNVEKATKLLSSGGAVSAYVAAAVAISPIAAVAQESAQPADASASGQPAAADDGLGAIIVTANKQEQAINDVSAAVAAFSADDLRNANVSDIKDLQILAPSLTVTEVFNIAQVYIRGVGTNIQNPGASSGVAIYADGAPIERQESQLASMFDLERVEVLSGPQGTLYGRNAIGGAVNYITAKPSDDLRGYARFGYGNYNASLLEAAVGGPINSWLKARVAFKMTNRDGFGKNIVTGNPVNDEHRQMGRLSLVIEPSSNFRAFISGEYYRQKDAAGVLTLDGGAWIDPATGKQTTSAGIIDPVTGNFAVVPTGLGGFATDPRDVAELSDPFNEKERWSATAQLDWDVANWLTISSINNIQKIVSWTSEALNKSTIFLYTNSQPVTRRIGDEPQASTELQFKFDTDYVNGILGATYFYEKQTENQTLGSDSLFSNIRSTANRDYLIQQGIDPTEVLSFCKGIGARILAEPGLPDVPPRICGWGLQEVEAVGLFGHANIDLAMLSDALSELTLKVGARYSSQSNDVYNPFFFFGYNSAFNDNPVAANITSFAWNMPETQHNHGKFNDFSPEIGLEWRPTEDMLLYYTYSEGFKAGTGLTVPGNTNLAGPEKIRNHEIGFKGSFADHRLQFNLAAYTYHLTGAQFQRSFPNPTGLGFLTVFENAADTKASGVEAEIHAIPYRSDNIRVEFDTSVFYQHSRFSDYTTVDPADPRLFQTPALPNTELVQNLAGNPTRNAPDWSGVARLGIQFRNLGLPGNGTLTWSSDVNYQSRVYLTEFKKLIESTGARALVGTQLRYENDNGITVSAWVKNLTNQVFSTGVTYVNAAGSTRLVSLSPPRMFGVTVGYDF